MEEKLREIRAVSYTHLDVYKRQVFGSGVQMLVAYIVLLVILALRPNGLFAASAVRK